MQIGNMDRLTDWEHGSTNFAKSADLAPPVIFVSWFHHVNKQDFDGKFGLQKIMCPPTQQTQEIFIAFTVDYIRDNLFLLSDRTESMPIVNLFD